jgi:hypothetical protein
VAPPITSTRLSTPEKTLSRESCVKLLRCRTKWADRPATVSPAATGRPARLVRTPRFAVLRRTAE